MPWIERCRLDERIAFVRLVADGEPMAALCRQFGISRQTGYKWWARFEEDGVEALADRSRRPRSHPNETPAHIVEVIIEARARHPFWGPRKLVAWLARKKPQLKLPAPSTVGSILKRNGLVSPRRTRRRAAPTPRADQALDANDVWATDFKGEFRTRDGKYCYPLTIQDQASRFLLRCQARNSTRADTAKPIFETAFREHGLPRVMLSDNGIPFASATFAGLTTLSVWWLELGIELARIEPGHPEQNGKLERFHRTLKNETTKPPKGNLSAQQRAFNRFRDEFNHDRPHEALADKTPASSYTGSTRAFPDRIAAPDYDASFELRHLNARGELQLNRFRFCVSGALKHKQIALEPIEDGLWRLHFRHQLLGAFNERTGLLTRPGFAIQVKRRT